jgi:hypothetical protein
LDPVTTEANDRFSTSNPFSWMRHVQLLPDISVVLKPQPLPNTLRLIFKQPWQNSSPKIMTAAHDNVPEYSSPNAQAQVDLKPKFVDIIFSKVYDVINNGLARTLR